MLFPIFYYILTIFARLLLKLILFALLRIFKSKIKNCAITTDIIVAFPTESEEDFNETLDVVNTCKFDSAFTFIFSKRAGTPAALMEDNLTEEEKNSRLYRLNEVVNKYALANNKKLEGFT